MRKQLEEVTNICQQGVPLANARHCSLFFFFLEEAIEGSKIPLFRANLLQHEVPHQIDKP
jgi:hypothetical protein